MLWIELQQDLLRQFGRISGKMVMNCGENLIVKICRMFNLNPACHSRAGGNPCCICSSKGTMDSHFRGNGISKGCCS